MKRINREFIRPGFTRGGSFSRLPHSSQNRRIEEVSKMLLPSASSRDIGKLRIQRPVLTQTPSVGLLPKLEKDSDKPELIRYQFQTPPRVRTPIAPQVYGFGPNQQRPPRLPKLEAAPLPPVEDRHPVNHSDSLPVTARATPEKPRKSKSRLDLPDPSPPPLGSITSIGVRTRTGMMNGRRKKCNQDAYQITQNCGGVKGLSLVSVFDGHGLLGHEVSAILRKTLPVQVGNALQRAIKTQHSVIEEEKALKAALYEGFLLTADEVFRQHKTDISFSGSTAVAVLLKENRVVCANVGDSRAILGRKTAQGWTAIPLSSDHKPDRPDERKRIESSGGRVEPHRSDPYSAQDGEFIGPARVWMKTEQVPGLAMSRSMGDLVASQVGVTSEPEIMSHELTNEDKIVVVASDGVWEFISSKAVLVTQCIELLTLHYETRNIEAACDKLLHESVIRWKRASGRLEEVVDDITFTVIFFD